MPFIRHARDKRGYESTFVMHAYRSGNGGPRTRVLYLFRSPSNVKVGRRALEPEVMEALEHTHPDLTFDWSTLMREPGLPRTEGRERPPRSARGGARAEATRPRQVDVPSPAVLEDESLLGRTVGPREAARLRARYNELMQRIVRRARTPEDRDRLTERAARLNPDEWTAPAAIHAAVVSVEAEWDAIASELPRRRRGRRGGRLRGEGRAEQPGEPAGDEPEASGIINESTATGEPNDDSKRVHLYGAGGDDRVGTDPEPADDQPDASDPGDDTPSGDADVPGGNGRHRA